MNKRYAPPRRCTRRSSWPRTPARRRASSFAQQADVLGVRLDEATSFVKPEVLRLGKARIARFLARDPALAIHRHPLDEILRMAPHTLDDAGEALVAQFGPRCSGTGGSAYSILANADLPWPTVRLATGEEVRLDQRRLHHATARPPNRDDRKQRHGRVLRRAARTTSARFGVSSTRSSRRTRSTPRCASTRTRSRRALDAQQVPVAVYDTLIAETNANLPTLHRYFRLRARMLGVEARCATTTSIRRWSRRDLRYPLAHGEARWCSRRWRRSAAEYVAAMDSGFDDRWMDVYPAAAQAVRARTWRARPTTCTPTC